MIRIWKTRQKTEARNKKHYVWLIILSMVGFLQPVLIGEEQHSIKQVPDKANADFSKQATGNEKWVRPTFYVSFNNNTGADIARGMACAGGFGCDIVPNGADGSALEIKKTGGYVHYRGAHNINARQGTLSFYCKGGAIAGKEGIAWLWQTRNRKYSLGIKVDEGKLHLICIDFSTSVWDDQGNLHAKKVISDISLSLGKISPSEWYKITASWDSLLRCGKLGINDRSVENKFIIPKDFYNPFIFFIGGSWEVRLNPGGMLQAGNMFDEFIYWNKSWKQLEKAVPLNKETRKLMDAVEDGVYLNLGTIQKLQSDGGWMADYTWPTMFGSFAQGRKQIDCRSAVSLGKMRGTALAASRFLYAYDVLNDEAFLAVAEKTGDFLLAAQSEKGYWMNQYDCEPGRIKPLDHAKSRAKPEYQDSVQSHALAFLLALHKVTGKKKYFDSAMRCGEFYLKTQNPNGSWSHHYNPKTGKGESHTGVEGAGEINDDNMNDAIDIMVLLYHVSGKTKFLKAIKKAGDWLINVKLSGKVHGWCGQYGPDNKPIAARHHEPACFVRRDTEQVVKALIEVYRLSGDQRYLKPGQQAADWLKQKFPDGKMYEYYDHETGRPIARWKKKIYYLDDPEQMKIAKQFPLASRTCNLNPIPDLEKLLKNARLPEKNAVKSDKKILAAAKRALYSQNEKGLWISGQVGSVKNSIGKGFSTVSVRLVHMLNYLENNLDSENLTRSEVYNHGNIFKMVVPPGRWYKVKWP